jgi:N-acetylglucosaminyldiphosphoundecaprenol N-acetyl-beta-D-mannosaminyltransferase
MSLNAVKILEIFITTDSKKKILEYCRKYLSEIPNPKSQIPKKTKKPLIIVTPNPEQVVYAQKDTHFASILNRADVAVPDGGRLVWASRFLRQLSTKNQQLTIKERIPGVELMEDLVHLAADRGFPIALIGGRGGVAVEAFECLRQKHSRLLGWAETGPEIKIFNFQFSIFNSKIKERQYFQRLGRRIVQSQARIVFVGLGAPKQEFFIEKLAYSLQRVAHSKRIEPKAKSYPLSAPLILMAVGGSFDIIGGRTPRAPLVIRSMGFEYIWRLLRQPWRVGRQFALLKFLWLVVREKPTV